MTMSPLRSVRVRAPAFTLLEVILALSIAVGLLVVVLYFYQQAAFLRDSTLASTSGLAAVRLCMDRLATELRTASAQADALRGGSQEIEFLQCQLPESGIGPTTGTGAETTMPPLLRRIRYALPTSGDNGAAPGLMRTETFVTATEPTPHPPEVTSEPEDTNEVWAVETATVEESGTRLTTSFSTAGAPPLRIPELRYLGLRYWDGAQWRDSWSESHLPRGVEVTLALDPVAADASPDAPPAEVFRRVIAIPAGLAASAGATPQADLDSAGLNEWPSPEAAR